jgi:hypothetical protein
MLFSSREKKSINDNGLRLPELGRGRRSRPSGKMPRRGKLLEIAAESLASGACFAGLLFGLQDSQTHF